MGRNEQATQEAPKKATLDDVAASMMAPTEGSAEENSEDKKQRRSPSKQDDAGAGPARDRSLSGGEDGQGNQIDNDDADTDTLDGEGSDDADDSIMEDAALEDGDQDSADAEDDDDPLSDVFGDDDADQDRDADGEENDALDTSKLGDDVKLSVTVDGEETEVTLGELKRRYAGEGAIEKRLQAATEARTKSFEAYDQGTQLIQQVMTQFGQALFQRTVPEPDPNLRNTNPQQYLLQKDLFEQETRALTGQQQQLYQLMQQVDAHNEEQKKAHRRQAAQQLREIMPVFKDPVKGPKVRDALINTAKEIGYSDADIAACTDPLMFKTMALAARELRRMKGMSVSKATEKARTLKQKGSNRSKPNVQQRRQAAAKKRARETGNIDDIAATMFAPAKKSR